MSTKSTKPVKVFRHLGISGSIFRNVSEKKEDRVPYFKVTLQRTYKDGDEFKTTSSFSRNDLPVAAVILNKCYEYVLEAESSEGNADESE